MAPSTLAGLALFAASLGPGFVYIRTAEKRRPRPVRSSLAEGVEMVVLGATISLVVMLGVLALAEGIELLDWRKLIEDSRSYIANHPYRFFGPLGFAVVLSYAVAAGLGWLLHREGSKDVHPGLTMWHQALWLERPSQAHSTVATVELRDGRRITGLVHGITSERTDNRELLMTKPLASANRGAPPVALLDEFVILREDDIVQISGRYYGPADRARDGVSTAHETSP